MLVYPTPTPMQSQTIEQGTYEIIRNRLLAQSNELQPRLAQLNEARKQVYSSIELKLMAKEFCKYGA